MKKLFIILFILLMAGGAFAADKYVLMYCDRLDMSTVTVEQKNQLADYYTEGGTWEDTAPSWVRDKEEIPFLKILDKLIPIEHFGLIAKQGAKRVWLMKIDTEVRLAPVKTWIDTYNAAQATSAAKIWYWAADSHEALVGKLVNALANHSDTWVKNQLLPRILRYPIQLFTENENDPKFATCYEAVNTYGLTLKPAVFTNDRYWKIALPLRID